LHRLFSRLKSLNIYFEDSIPLRLYTGNNSTSWSSFHNLLNAAANTLTVLTLDFDVIDTTYEYTPDSIFVNNNADTNEASFIVFPNLERFSISHLNPSFSSLINFLSHHDGSLTRLKTHKIKFTEAYSWSEHFVPAIPQSVQLWSCFGCQTTIEDEQGELSYVAWICGHCPPVGSINALDHKWFENLIDSNGKRRSCLNSFSASSSGQSDFLFYCYLNLI